MDMMAAAGSTDGGEAGGAGGSDRAGRGQAGAWVRASTLWAKRWARRWIGRALAQGPLPKHVALIMDGNRRFARGRGEAVSHGHTAGYYTLLDCLEWLRDLGTTHVTAYAFSLENFRRPEDEVAALMDLAALKLDQLRVRLARERANGGQRLTVRIVGDLAVLPPRVRRAASRIMLETRGCGGLQLDIAFGYTSSAELAAASARVVRAVAEGHLRPQDVTEDVLEQCMWTRGAREPDMVLRTSGETRLSDFLLWQGGYAELVFQRVLWPNFSFLHLVSAICAYQRGHADLEAARRYSAKVHHCRRFRTGYTLPGSARASSLVKAEQDEQPRRMRSPSPSSPLASRPNDTTVHPVGLSSASASSDEEVQFEEAIAVASAPMRIANFFDRLEDEQLALLRQWADLES